MRRLHQCSTHVEKGSVCSDLPIGEVGDELQHDPSQSLIRFNRRLPPLRPAMHTEENPAGLLLEIIWTM